MALPEVYELLRLDPTRRLFLYTPEGGVALLTPSALDHDETNHRTRVHDEGRMRGAWPSGILSGRLSIRICG